MSEKTSTGTSESADDGRLSQSRLSTYLRCPRQYEYDYVWDVNAPDEFERAKNRGNAIHTALEWLCTRVHAPDPDASAAPWRDDTLAPELQPTWEPMDQDAVADAAIMEWAQKECAAAWNDETTAADYLSDAHRDYDRRIVADAVQTYLEERGCSDLRRSVACEIDLEFSYRGLELSARPDNIVAHDDHLEILDYKTSLSNVFSDSYWSPPYLEEHMNGDGFHPSRVGSLIQAAVYIEAVKSSPGLAQTLAGADDASVADAAVEFTFCGMLGGSSKDVSVEATPEGTRPAVEEITERLMFDIYDDRRETLWSLIEECYEGIQVGEFDPSERMPDRVDDSNGVCDRCAYKTMCPDVLELEVSRRD